ncbi:hypothetical protein HETIRDRAFT_418337 [Heterobasidion irregulare TC 32-1]|uniref:CCHC-type domain-containing protein n=1 Tax=Heterobasidion irregulare (strain TC 32-1) TaxID=747525 RepID=W4K4N5_HETIT|nr:uncharacterized protein HETIRDRAFT_418337 [Heterobasidion irregulare TC 32-1]ETW80310.1 hypothetical protein HETIRDRAFT_418337 [Heterobasidion irregulare TC 32-1]
MSLTIRKFHFLESPRYIMADFHHATYPRDRSHSQSPPFLLRPVSAVSDDSDDSSDSLASVDHINGVTVDDPHFEIGVSRLPSRLEDPHTPNAGQIFAQFNTTPRVLIPVYPSPIYDLTHYLNPNLVGALYHITFTDDEAPIMLDQSGLDDPANFFFYLQQIVMTRAYQVHQGPLSRHQMTLLSNLALTSYRNKGLFNLPALRSDMISYRPTGYTERLVIEEYMPGGTLPERLFPTNSRGEQHVAAYWSEGSNPADNERPWYMARSDVTAEDGYHLPRPEELLYKSNAPRPSGDVGRPPVTPLILSLPEIPESSLTTSLPHTSSSPLRFLPSDNTRSFRHAVSAERTTVVARLEEDDPMPPASPPHDSDQNIRNREARRPLPTPPSAPPDASSSATLVGEGLALAEPIDTSSYQLRTIPVVSEDWHEGARASAHVWPETPAFTPSPLGSPPAPDERYCWECGRQGHFLATCPITRIRMRTDVTARQFLRDYDAHRGATNRLRLQMDKVAEEYGYHKQALEHMITTSMWTGYPVRSIPTYDVDHPREPPPVVGAHSKRRRLV